MATVPIRALSVAKTIHGNSPWTLTFPEAASQTYKLGSLVGLDSSGNLAVCGTDPLNILGVAAQDASGVTGTAQTVWIADDETVFVGNLFTAQTSDQRDIAKGYGVTIVGNNWTVDKTKLGTSRRVIVVDLDRRDNVGDIQARVHFLFLSTNRQLDYTS